MVIAGIVFGLVGIMVLSCFIVGGKYERDNFQQR